MRRIISVLLICFSSAWALAQDAKPIELAPDAPDRHVVVKGDTLWGISSKFLKDPYRWPEIWRLNPDEVKNPHRIYPGQVIVLDRSGAQPQLKLGDVVKAEPKMYVSDLKDPIPAIPQQVIEPFLTRPLIADPAALENTARIIAFQDDRLSVSAGGVVYASKVKPGTTQWLIMRAGKPLPDPDNPEQTLGLEATYIGSARLTKDGEPATLQVTSSRQEIARNDYLVPAPKADIVSYVPHAPTQAVNGRIISIGGGISEGGRLSVVSISRGKQNGLEIGHVLGLHRSGVEVVDPAEDSKATHRLPDERYGLLFIFRVFDRVAYGLVLEAARTVKLGDAVRTP